MRGVKTMDKQTVNEIRKEHGQEPLEDGDVILDPSWLNYKQQQEMQKQGDQMDGEGQLAGDLMNPEDQPGEEGQPVEEGQAPTETGFTEPNTEYNTETTSDEEDNQGEEPVEKSYSMMVINLD